MEKAFYIGKWLIEPSLNRISQNGTRQTVEPRLIRILCQFADQPGQLVRREELMDDVWGKDVVVTENSLNNSISELRRLLEDDPKDPQIIETIRSSGYRVVAPVRWVSNKSARIGDTPDKGHLKIGKSLKVKIGVGTFMLAGILSVLVFRWASSPLPAQRHELSIKPLTTLQGAEYGPSFSPDGNQVAFVRFAQDAAAADVYVQDIRSGTPIQLTDLYGAEFFPTWSPNGQKIAFVWNRQEGCGIYEVPSQGGKPRELLKTNYSVRHLDWSPDGRHLVFSYAYDDVNAQHIARFNLETNELEALTNPGVTENDIWPIYSPDGKSLAFRRATSERSEDLYVMSLEDEAGSARQLTYQQSPIQGHDWSANGKRLVFAASRGQIRGLWSLELLSGKLDLIRTIGAREVNHFTIARTSKRAAFIQETTEVNLYKASFPAGVETPVGPVFHSTYMERYLQFSPDGQHVVFVSNRSGYPEIWQANEGGDGLIRLTNLQNPWTSRPRWSPDGQYIVFESRESKTSGIYLVSADGGPASRITKTSANEIAPSWSADGQFIYYGSDQSERWEIWKRPAEGGKPLQVTHGGGMVGVESFDGQFLFFTRIEPPSLLRLEKSTGIVDVLAASLLNQSMDNFSVTKKSVYFLNWNVEASHFSLFRHQIADDITTRIMPLPLTPLSYYYQWGFAVSPDEDSIIWAQIDDAESDVMLIENFE